MPQPVLPKGIEPMDITDWENAHQNFTNKYTKGASFALRVFSPNSTIEDYNATTANIQWLIQYAIDNKTTLRAMGNNWSFSQVAVCNGGMISTKALNLRFKAGPGTVHPDYLKTGKTHEDLLLVQCGMSIFELNDLLECDFSPRRCIRASGGSNGQSVAGATSTGTHGGALYTGAVHDAIVGLHIVTSAKRHVWLERASYPVASETFTNLIGAEVIRDDEMFNAALVSFGSFGMIHGIMLETDPIFLLQEYRFDYVPYNDAIVQAICNQDIDQMRTILNTLADNNDTPEAQKVRMPDEAPDKKLYHLEIALNPHNFEKNNPEKGIYIRTFYKIPFPADYVPHHDQVEDGKTYGDDTMGIISRVMDTLGPVVSKPIIAPLVNSLFKTTLRAAQPAPQTIGETFRFTRFRGKIASAALAVDCADIAKVIEVVLQVNATNPFAGGIALRFVKGTPALLGFTRFPKTCVLEMDGVDAGITRTFFTKVWQQLETQGIHYTLHWGKLNFILNEQRVRKMYTDERVDKWLSCRASLMDDDSRKVFTNPFMTSCGLDKTAAPKPTNV